MKRPFFASVLKGSSINRSIRDFFSIFNPRTFLSSLGIVLMLMVCLPATNAVAQVEWSSRYVTLATADQVNPSVAKPPNPEYTVIVWEDRRSDSSDIYAQMIESNTGLAMWDPIDGVPVCTAVGAQRNPRAAYDSLGGVIIVWEDYRDRYNSEVLDTTVMDIFAHRIILSSGQLDANWSANPDGVPVCVRTGQRARGPRIAGTTDGAYITWTDFRNSTGHPNYYNRDVYIQYLLVSTGSHPSGYNWVSNGINVTIVDPCQGQTPCDQQNPDIVVDFSVATQLNRYGAIVVYEDDRSDPWQIFADNIGADGSNLWGDDLHVAEHLQADQIDPHIASTDSSGYPLRGAIVTWQDTRNWIYTEEDLYAQRIPPDGNLIWSQSGEAICTADGVQRRPRITASGADVLIVWEDLRDEATTGVDVYCNVMDADTRDLSWLASTAGLLCDELEDQLAPEADIISNFVVAWEDWRQGTTSDIYGNELPVNDPTQYRWPGMGQPITLGKHGQIKPQVSGEVIVWQDGRRQPIPGNRLDQRADTNIYAQKLGDECDLPTEMLWRDEFVKWSWAFDATSHRMAVDREGSQYVAWVETRVIGESTMEHVFVQKLDRDGVPKWLNDGVLVSGGEDPGTDPDICVDDEEGCFVTWVKGGNQIHLAHVDYNGDIAEVLNVSAALGAGYTPRVVEDDAGGVLIGYHNTANDVVLAHYDDGLNWIDDQSIPNAGVLAGAWAGLKMSKDREGGAWLVWYNPSIDYLGGHYNGVSLPAGPIPVGGFASIGNQFDIDTDYLSSSQPNNETQYDCLFAGVGTGTAPARQDVWVARMNFVLGALKITGTSNITENNSRPSGQGLAHDSWHPAISADSLAFDWSNPYAPEIGGALVSFTDSYTDPNVQQTRYSVLSGRAIWKWPGGGYAFDNYIPSQHGDYVLDDDMTHEALSDIAVRMGDFEKTGANDPVYGVVVWSSDNTSGCLSPLAVLAPLIDYSDATQNSAFKWSATGTPVARIYGTTEQIEPMIKATPIGGEFVPNYPLPVLWSDSRSGTRCLLMSRVYNDEVLGEMRWIKEAEHATPLPTALRIQQGYPHPVSLSQHGGFTLPYTIDQDADAVIEFHDMLGRKAAVLSGVRLTAGSSYHHIPASSYRSLAPGLYQLSVITSQTRAQRRIVLVR